MANFTFENSMKILQSLCLAILPLVLISFGEFTADAQSVFSPAGLTTGDQYRLVFVTDGIRDGASVDILDYNRFVTSEANRAGSLIGGISINWTAIASTPTVDAILNTNTDPSPLGDTGVPLYLVDGVTRFADHYDEIWPRVGAFSSLVPLDINQFGQGVGDQTPWTGTDSNGVALSDGLGGLVSGIGSTRFNWIANGGLLSAEQHPFYGISPVLTVPEPGGSALILLAGFSLLARRRDQTLSVR